jgi:hypothetical protein
MRSIVFSLLLVCSLNSFAKGTELPPELPAITEVQVSQLFDEQFFPNITDLVDFVDREEKITVCVSEYIKKQSKSYSKIVQNNLYDLIHNFDRITSKIYGKKQSADEIPYEDKIEALGRVQCEAYYKMGVLK